MFRTAIIALLAAEVAAISSIKEGATMKAGSNAAQRLLSKAKSTGRKLEDAQMAMLAGMDLQYTGCYNVFGLAEDGGQDGLGVTNMPVVTFSLANGGKSVGEYAVNMFEFIDSYTESTLQQREWECENYREYGCYCDGQENEDYCEYQCMAANNMGDCVDNDDGQEEFEIQRYLECREMEANNDNQYNGYQQNQQQGGNQNWGYNNAGYEAYPNWDGQYMIGPYCASDGKSILLGVFYDDQCTIPADDGLSVYSSANWGQSLPYSSESIIPSGTKLSCINQENNANNYQNNQNGNNNWNNYNANNNQWNNMEPSEFCQQAYEVAAKCETDDGGIYYPTSTGCDFINKYLPTLSSSTPYHIKSSSGSGAVVFAWLFAITTIMFGGYAYFLYRKIKRGGMDLASQEGGAMA